MLNNIKKAMRKVESMKVNYEYKKSMKEWERLEKKYEGIDLNKILVEEWNN